MDNLYLVYVEKVGELNGMKEYDFFFSNNPDSFWGDGFDCNYANQETIIPDKRTYNKVLRLRTPIPFFCIQHNRCFSMQHAIDGVVAIAFEDISDYENYPEPYRIVFDFGENYDSVESKLASRSQLFTENE